MRKAIFCAAELSLFLMAQGGGSLITNFYNFRSSHWRTFPWLASAPSSTLAHSWTSSTQHMQPDRRPMATRSVPHSSHTRRRQPSLRLFGFCHLHLPSHYNVAFCPKTFTMLKSKSPEFTRQLPITQDQKGCPSPKKSYPFHQESQQGAAQHHQSPGLLSGAALGSRLCSPEGAGHGQRQPALTELQHPLSHLQHLHLVHHQQCALPKQPGAPHHGKVHQCDHGKVLFHCCKDMLTNQEGPSLCVRTTYLAA